MVRGHVMVSQASPRALVVLRVPHGATAPDENLVRAAIAADRKQLGLPPDDLLGYRIAGPYPVALGDSTLDEYVAWEA
jgi:hypothetical protein